MSIGSVDEANALLNGVQEQLREGSVSVQGVIGFLERMAEEMASLGLDDFAGQVNAAKDAAEEFATEIDGLCETGVEDLQGQIAALAERS